MIKFFLVSVLEGVSQSEFECTRRTISPVIVDQRNSIQVSVGDRIQVAVDDSLGLGVGEVTVILRVTRNGEHAGSIADIEEVIHREHQSQIGRTFANFDGERLVNDNVKEEAPRQTSSIIATHNGTLSMAELLRIRTT